MSTALSRDGSSPAPASFVLAEPTDDVTHIVGWWQWFLGDVLRLVIPRGLCGESLAWHSDQPDPVEVCSRCVALSNDAPTKYVAGYQVHE
ncbi:hypothetical protein [Mycobacteroides abscessus]|uniref:hypothetical protein n=1 Tax=Mycobacteroides abscessus TaxID=36809 RepID=UPI000C266B67|nr:hypothetical protein [Mycobacteroides abscessus]